MPNALKILIVDDEFHARKLLSQYVSKLSFLELAGMCSNVFEAMSFLQNEKIDILLLDIQMPEITGLEFARSLKNPPAIIFTTAYSEYAVESYELNVLDYLLKPIAFPRFLQAINKIAERNDALSPVSAPPPRETSPVENAEENNRIIIKSGAKLIKIQYADLMYIEGQREYVTFHTRKQRIVTLYSLKDLEEKLPSNQFVRIHKSYIVSLRYIDSIEKKTVQISDKTLPIGDNYKDNFMELFEKM